MLVDWDEVQRLAVRRLPAQPPLSEARRRELAAGYNRLAARLREPLLAAVGGLPAGAALPDFEALDRESWLDLNLGILRRTMEPLLDATTLPHTRLTDLGRAGVDHYVALVLGFLSTRVLGQYDAQLLGKEPLPDAPGLYLVEPNIATWEKEAGLPADDLRRWLILHELTHAWQFAAHPWLREHLNGALETVLAAAGDASRHPLSRLAGMTTGMPSQWAAIRRMQATMSLIEGYGNLVMNQVGRAELAAFDELEAAYRTRSDRKGPLELLFWRLTGLELKLQQYKRGEAFCTAILSAHGMAALNKAWESEANLPQPGEIGNPDAWFRRVSGRDRGFTLARAPLN